MQDVTKIRVETGALQAAAGAIAGAANTARDGVTQVKAADAIAAAAFGGEPTGVAFTEACARAIDAIGGIADTAEQLAQNTAAAAQGYITTDAGAIPSSLRLVYGSVQGSPFAPGHR